VGSSSLYDYLFAAFSFFLGASIGSFLNVCIYRLPLNMSVNEPRRSFCPSCRYTIPLHHNIPLLTWLILRGRCANCGAKISFRYFGVELLTALLFLAIWLKVWVWGRPGWPEQAWVMAPPYWIMASLFVVATFIDFEHFIIPDEITIGGAAAGVLLSFAIPTLHDETSRLFGGLWSLFGAGLGYAALWSVVQLGKLAFGKKRRVFAKAAPFTWIRRDQEADFTIGVEKMLWSDFFHRGSEQILMKCAWIEIDGERFKSVEVRMECDWLHLEKRKWQLEKVDEIRGDATDITLPREAMGFGDVKFIACIGAFLGWKAVLFTIMAASTIGAVVGLAVIALGRKEWSTKIPFGPYLALAAMVWLFHGPEFVNWYWTLMLPAVR
jgi:leader peptidase (prepilin peptidase)/N-methyltransferase